MKIAGVVLLRLAIMVGLVVTFFGAAALVIPAWLIDLVVERWADCPCLNAREARRSQG